jgi:hypothetical protein
MATRVLPVRSRKYTHLTVAAKNQTQKALTARPDRTQAGRSAGTRTIHGIAARRRLNRNGLACAERRGTSRQRPASGCRASPAKTVSAQRQRSGSFGWAAHQRDRSGRRHRVLLGDLARVSGTCMNKGWTILSMTHHDRQREADAPKRHTYASRRSPLAAAGSPRTNSTRCEGAWPLRDHRPRWPVAERYPFGIGTNAAGARAAAEHLLPRRGGSEFAAPPPQLVSVNRLHGYQWRPQQPGYVHPASYSDYGRMEGGMEAQPSSSRFPIRPPRFLPSRSSRAWRSTYGLRAWTADPGRSLRRRLRRSRDGLTRYSGPDYRPSTIG